MKQYGDTNLDVPYSDNRCREYGRSWCSDELKSYALKHLIQAANQVTSAEDAWVLIGGSYVIQVCSNRGFARTRDNDGFLKARGTWDHALSVIGRRTTASGRRGFLVLNSWGEDWCSGPLFEDQPKGSFYCDFNTMDGMLRQGDSFNLIDFHGFRPIKLDWSEI